MRGVWLTATLSVLGLACASAGRNTPSFDSAEAASLQRGPRGLRVMTFNIQSARRGLDAVAAVIRDASPDVIALQEVDKGTTLAQGRDQTHELALRTGYPHEVHFRAANMRGGEYGVALLSKFPVLEAEQFALPTPRSLEPRTVGRALLNVDGREVSVYVTHLSNGGDRSELRIRQARFIARWMSRDPRPKVLMGDLNDGPDSAAVLGLSRRLSDAFSRTGHGRAETYPLPLFLPDLRLDYVMASAELAPLRSFVVRRVASDHFPLVADFELKSGGSGLAASAGAP